MKIKELIEQLKQLDENAKIYIYGDFEMYEPVIQDLYDTETQEDYFLLTRY